MNGKCTKGKKIKSSVQSPEKTQNIGLCLQTLRERQSKTHCRPTGQYLNRYY